MSAPYQVSAFVRATELSLANRYLLDLPTDHACTRIEVVSEMIAQHRAAFDSRMPLYSFEIGYADGDRNVKRVEIFADARAGGRIAQLLSGDRNGGPWLADILAGCYEIVFDFVPPSEPVTIKVTKTSAGQRTSHEESFPPKYGGVLPKKHSYTRREMILELLSGSRQSFGMFDGEITHLLLVAGPAVKYGSCVLYESTEFGRMLKLLTRDTINSDLETALTELTRTSNTAQWDEVVFSTRWVRPPGAPDANAIYEEFHALRVKRNHLELLDGMCTTGCIASSKRMMAGKHAAAFAYFNRREEELLNALSIAYDEERSKRR